MSTTQKDAVQLSMFSDIPPHIDPEVREAMEHALNNPAAQLIFAVIALFDNVTAWFAARRRVRENAQILNGLSDQILADIGLQRWQISHVSTSLSRGIDELEVQLPTGISRAAVVDLAHYRKRGDAPELPLAA